MAQHVGEMATIERESGSVPDTRFEDAMAAQLFGRRLIENDRQRAYKRARCNGLVDGNPPYSVASLRKAGRAEACNVNWGVARAFLEAATGPFYDLFSESSGYIEVTSGHGTDEQRAEWSRIISEVANELLGDSEDFDNLIQLSQWQMVQHGCGPLLFEDGFEVFPLPMECGDVKVPEFTRSNTRRWEVFAAQAQYYPSELYQFIENQDAAQKLGWNVAYTKDVIANAVDVKQANGVMYDWEFYQHQMKQNALTYMDDSKVCWVMHIFWKEFDGKITHAIVERDGATTGTKVPAQYLFFARGRYQSFAEAIHPMYFDRGNGGYHHAVTGLGVKMYPGMFYENMLLCKMADDAFLPKNMFAPTSPSSTQKFSLQTFGSWGVMPAGFELKQSGVAGLIQDELMIHKELRNVVESNLSAYRQQAMKQEGNPVTAKQVMFDAQQQSSLSNTQINRYYAQLDGLYREIYRRLSNLNSPHELAKSFREKCEQRKVPKEAYAKVDRVRAIRVVGQGNSFMRQQALQSAWQLYGPALSQEGRDRMLTDALAAGMGYLAASRYNPHRKQNEQADDQRAEAMLQVAAMKVGVPPVVTATQNAVTYAATFLQASSHAVQSLQSGGNPADVLNFLHLAGPGIAAHLARFGKDPQHLAVGKAMQKQLLALGKIVDELQKQMKERAQQQQQQSGKTQGVMSDVQIKQLKAKNDIAIKTAKARAQMQQSQEKHQMKILHDRQDLVVNDARAAAEIHRNRLKSMATNGDAE